MLRLNGRMRAMTDDWRGGENYIECFFVVAEEEEGEGQREEEDEWSGVECGGDGFYMGRDGK